MASAVGNIFIGLHVNTQGTRAFTTAAGQIDRDSKRMSQALSGTSRSVTSLRGTMSQGVRAHFLNDAIRQAALANNEVAKLRASMLALSSLTGTSVTGAFAATFLLQTADAANRLTNQLRTVTDSEENLIGVRQRLFNISQLTRSDMQATVTLYARISRAARDFGASQEDVARATETIQKAFAIGGASQAEAQGAAIQLSQGIASNRFSGEEYRSVAENAPVLLQEMARYLDVSIGKLREMAHAGELTGDVVTKAILGASTAIDEDFNKTVSTLGQGLNLLGNAFMMYVGETDAAVGGTRRLAEALANLAENFANIAPWLTGAAFAGLSVLGGRLAGRVGGGVLGGLGDTVKVSRDNAAALQAANVAAYANAKANADRARSAKQAADADVAATRAKIAENQQASASLRHTLALAQVQRERAVATTELNRGIMEATGRVGLYNNALAQQNEATKTVIATQRALRATESELAANKVVLAKQTTLAATAANSHGTALAAVGAQAKSASAGVNALRTAGVAASRIGGGFLNLLGGWTGVAFTAAIAGIGLFMDNAARAEERTRRLVKEMHSLGLVSDRTAGYIEDTAASIKELTAAQAGVKIGEYEAELSATMQRLVGLRGELAAQMATFANAGIGSEGGLTSIDVNSGIGDSAEAFKRVIDVIDQVRAGTISAEDAIREMNAAVLMPGADRGLAEIVDTLTGLVEVATGATTQIETLGQRLAALSLQAGVPEWLRSMADGVVTIQEFSVGYKAALDLMEEITGEQIKQIGLSTEEADILEIMNDLRDEAVERGAEEAKINDAVLRKRAEQIRAAELAKDAEEDRAEAQKKGVEALQTYMATVAGMKSEVAAFADSWSDGDRAASDMIASLLDGFSKGQISADHLHKELTAIGRTNVSGGMLDLITKLQGAIPLAANLLNFMGRIAGISVGAIDAPRVIGDFVEQEIANSRMTSDQKYRSSMIDQYLGQDLGNGIKMTREQAEELADAVIANEQAVDAMADSMKSGAAAADKFAEGMAELNSQLAAAPLSDFERAVLASAEGMGASRAELDAYIAAVKSGGLASAPKKFQDIAAAMREINAVNLMRDLQQETAALFRSPIDQRIFETLEGSGIEFNSVQGQMIADQVRLNDSLAEFRDIASSALKGFINDLKDGKSLTEALFNALGKIGERMLDKSIDALINNAMGVLGGRSGLPGKQGPNPIAALTGAVETGAKKGAESGTVAGQSDFWSSLLGGDSKNGGGLAGVLGPAIGGLGLGYQTQDPLTGGLMGAVAGASGGPLGMLVGGIGGLIGGFFGMNQALEQAREKLNSVRGDIDSLIDVGDGRGIGKMTQTFRDFADKSLEYQALAAKAQDGALQQRLQNAVNTFFNQINADFELGFEGTLGALSSGQGMNGAFLSAQQGVVDLREELKGFIADTQYLGEKLGELAGIDNAAKVAEDVARAERAAQEFALSLLSGSLEMTEMEQSVAEVQGRVSALQITLEQLGMSAAEAEEAIADNLSLAMAKLRDEYLVDVSRSINEMSGFGYLNEITAAQEKYQERLRDSAALGLDGSTALNELNLSLTKIIKSAGLSQSEIHQVAKAFPALSGIIDAVAGEDAIQSVQEAEAALRASYEAQRSELDLSISRLQRFAKSIRDFREGLRLSQSSPLGQEEQVTEALRLFRKTATAAAGGDVDSQDRLAEVSQSALDEAREYYASSEAYAQIWEEIDQTLANIEGSAGSQLSHAERQRDLLEQQVSALIAIDDSVQSVAIAMSKLTAAVLQRDAKLADSAGQRRNYAVVDEAFRTYLGRDADEEGKAYWTRQMNAGKSASEVVSEIKNSPEAQLRKMYRKILDREPDEDGLRFYIKQMSDGRPASEIEADLLYAKSKGSFASGGYTGDMPSSVISGVVHGQEFVVNATATRKHRSFLERINSGEMPGNDNRAMVEELRAVRSELASVKAELARQTGVIVQSDEATRQVTREGNSSLRELSKSQKRANAS